MNMTPKLRDALQRLAPGIDAAALAAEDADETKQDELAAAVDSAASLLDDLKKLLDLAEAAGNADIKAAVEAMLEKAKQGEAAKAEADDLKLSAEKRERAEIYAKAEAERKLTPAMKPWADSLDVAALAAWYKVAPVAVPGELPKTPPETPESVPLSAEDEKAIAMLGLDRKAYIATKKNRFGTNQEGN